MGRRNQMARPTAYPAVLIALGLCLGACTSTSGSASSASTSGSVPAGFPSPQPHAVYLMRQPVHTRNDLYLRINNIVCGTGRVSGSGFHGSFEPRAGHQLCDVSITVFNHTPAPFDLEPQHESLVSHGHTFTVWRKGLRIPAFSNTFDYPVPPHDWINAQMAFQLPAKMLPTAMVIEGNRVSLPRKRLCESFLTCRRQ